MYVQIESMDLRMPSTLMENFGAIGTREDLLCRHVGKHSRQFCDKSAVLDTWVQVLDWQIQRVYILWL
jgi:hypothetical protein